MKKIVVANQKGGVGKTTIAFHLAAHLRESGNRVIVVDLDTQSHATLLLLGKEPDRESLTASDLIVNKTQGRSVPTGDLGIDCVPGDDGLTSSVIGGMEPSVAAKNLSAALDAFDDQYDVCIIDTPPTLGPVLAAAIYCGDFLLVPLRPEKLVLSGLSKLLETIKVINPGLIKGGNLAIVVSMVRWVDRIHLSIAKKVKGAMGNLVLKESITERTAVHHSMGRNGKPVWATPREYKSQSQRLASKEMKLLTTEIERRIA